jgi:hypothetical protein
MLLISKNYAQVQKKPEDFGYKSMAFKFQSDRVDLIIISKVGDEKVTKPLFFFCQGSLPKPILIYNEKGLHATLPFSETLFLNDYHIVIVAKPYIPTIANANELGEDFLFLKDKTRVIPPKGYTDRNYLDYYVFRNNFVLKQLFKERWVDKSKLVVTGHAEGSAIAAKMASIHHKITHLIYSDGNPFGQIATILNQEQNVVQTLDYWKEVVEKSAIINYDNVNTFKAIHSFSLPQRENLLGLTIPILVLYGGKKSISNCIDLFQLEVISTRKQNFSFLRFANIEQDFLSFNTKNGNHCNFDNWSIATVDWLKK